jgi:NAD(P)H-dependent FMN reductase
MAEFDCPSYNADVQRDGGFPAGADELRGRLEASDAFVICSPEYNASMPGVLKNAVDWVSRFHPQPFHERHALLLSASPSMVGGNRGVWALRVPFEHLGARIYPDMFSLARAHLALDDDGQIADEELQLHGSGRGVQALPLRQERMGRVPRRASRTGDRSRAVTRSARTRVRLNMKTARFGLPPASRVSSRKPRSGAADAFLQSVAELAPQTPLDELLRLVSPQHHAR